MTDTVWMRLTVIQTTENSVDLVDIEPQQRHFMFGQTGVTYFRPNAKAGTDLMLFPTSRVIAVVEEDQDTIFALIAKIRGTHAKQSKKKASKAKTSKRQKSRKV